jgi:hypothetical protein
MATKRSPSKPVRAKRGPKAEGEVENMTCSKCGGNMEPGVTTAPGLMGQFPVNKDRARLEFVIPGTPTPLNPVKAFKQGMSDDPGRRVYRITGFRCSQCGLLELHADGDPHG